MDDAHIEQLTATELIRHVYHYLNQHSHIALGFAALLAEEQYCGFTNGFTSEKQKEIILRLKREIEKIHELNEEMAQWLTHHREDAQ